MSSAIFLPLYLSLSLCEHFKCTAQSKWISNINRKKMECNKMKIEYKMKQNVNMNAIRNDHE